MGYPYQPGRRNRYNKKISVRHTTETRRSIESRGKSNIIDESTEQTQVGKTGDCRGKRQRKRKGLANHRASPMSPGSPNLHPTLSSNSSESKQNSRYKSNNKSAARTPRHHRKQPSSSMNNAAHSPSPPAEAAAAAASNTMGSNKAFQEVIASPDYVESSVSGGPEERNGRRASPQAQSRYQSRLQSPSPLHPIPSDSSGLHDLPVFQRLDSTESFSTKPLEAQIDHYFDSTNFKHHPLLANPHHQLTLKNGMNLVYLRKNILFCIDVEAWEVNPKIVTEIGISIYDPRGQVLNMVPYITQIHIIIKENQHLKNGRYVPEHSKNFNGGTTYILGQSEAVKFTQDLVEYYFFRPKQDVSTCLVGHDLKGDITWFKNLGIRFPPSTKLVDTQTIFSASHGHKGNSLKNALRASNLPYAFLHNAGNDSYYTLLLAMTLCDPQARKINRLDHARFEPDPLDPSPNPSPQVQYLSPGQSSTNSGGKRRNRLGPNVSEFVHVQSVQEMIDTLFLED